tara:strand:- start:4951 stop:5412 length:462 start_codon:yes stop_codon:yes gene_type:complete
MAEKNNFKNILLLFGAVGITAFLFKRLKKMDRPSKNFTWAEFASKDGAEMPAAVKANIKKLAQNLEVIRSYFNLPIKINSGWRSEAHNRKIGGVKNSQHVKGKAADITVKGKTPGEVQNGIELLINAGKISQGGIGKYPNFTHYDIRGTKARW